MPRVHKLTDVHWQEEKRKELVEESYRTLLEIFDVLEESLLPSRKEKKLYPQIEEVHSNIYEANQELAFNDWIIIIIMLCVT